MVHIWEGHVTTCSALTNIASCPPTKPREQPDEPPCTKAISFPLMTHRGQGQWFMPSLTFRNSAALLFHSHPILLIRQWLCHLRLSRERVEACFISCQKVVPKKKGHSHLATTNLLLSKGEQSAKRLACVSPA